MYSTGGNETIIPLSGNITSKGTFVLGFTLSDEAIIQIAEMLSTSLDFTRQNSLELWGPNGLIDRVGDINISEADAINIAAAIADPVNYLNTLNLNLGSLTNLVARRKTTVVEGDPNFVQPSTNWTIAPNGDVSNLGTFQNVCMDNAEISFLESSYTIYQNNPIPTPINLVVVSSGFGSWLATVCGSTGGGGTTAFPGSQYNFQSTPNSYCVSNYNISGNMPIDYLTPSNQQFSGSRTAMLSLSSTDPNVSINPNYNTASLTVIGSASGVEELLKKYNVSIFPNCINSYATISINSDGNKYEIINILGANLFSGNLESGETQVDFSFFNEGSYIVKITTIKNEVIYLKIIKI
ncbi:MAG: T9SS type A sorting domain-containing protein [Bacteroidia bacterium]